MQPLTPQTPPQIPARDPAPSRLSYRMQRWMLTPGIRTAIRFGLPLALVLAGAGGYLASETRRDNLMLLFSDLRVSIEERPEFMVGLMAIDGAGELVSQDIREVVPIDFPISSFDLDIEEIRDVIAGLDPVKEASVRIRPGGVLQVDVTERVPTVVWRTHDGLALLDETGVEVAELPSRKTRADLPLIAGQGADAHVAEAMVLFSVAEPLSDRLRGLLRVGERRWDVVLDRGQRILLPEQDPVSALRRVIALGQAQDLLERDLTVVDMRLSERPTLRMSQEAVQDWWQIRTINGSGQ